MVYDCAPREFLLVEKRLGLTRRNHDLPWKGVEPPEVDSGVAKRIGVLPVAMATGADVSADGLRLFVATYGDGYELTRKLDETWQAAVARGGESVSLPKRRQGEAVCYGLDGQTIFLTSEKRPCPLFSIKRPGTLIENGAKGTP